MQDVTVRIFVSCGRRGRIGSHRGTFWTRKQKAHATPSAPEYSSIWLAGPCSLVVKPLITRRGGMSAADQIDDETVTGIVMPWGLCLPLRPMMMSC